MIGAVRLRIAAFLVLSAVGVVYVTTTYLGLVDRVLGRDIVVTASLPGSGGLFVGSAVDYRGVKIGKVTAMTPTREGVDVQLTLQHGTRLPTDAALEVHNLSAVGEQYLDFQPTDSDGPYAEDGTRFEAGPEALPVPTSELLVELDRFVGSVDKPALRDVVRELGTMFEGTGRPLQRLLDDGGRFVDTAAAHTDQTIRLLDRGLVVLRTQADGAQQIRDFSRGLKEVAATLRGSDGDLRTVLQGTPGAARQVQALLTQIEPTLPVLLGNAISVNQVVVNHLAGVEQLLVTFPRTISSGFTGTPPDGYGHIDLQFDNAVTPCTKGFKPPSQWRPPSDLTDSPIFPAECESGPPYEMRGPKMSPDGYPGLPGRDRTGAFSSYDPLTGVMGGAVDARGRHVRFSDPGDLSIMGNEAWKWLLVGPVTGR